MKKGKLDINLLFSSFLVIGFVICAHFFIKISQTFPNPFNDLIPILVFAVFGLLLFYATRVGEGKQIVRLNLFTLLIILPAIYMIVAVFVEALPMHDLLITTTTLPDGQNTYTTINPLLWLASISMGYAIPYTFLSGFEMEQEASDEAQEAGEATDESEDTVSDDEVPESDTQENSEAENTVEEEIQEN